MNNPNNLYEHLQQMSGGKNANINILQEEIDIDLQVDYFKKAKEVKKNLDKNYDYLTNVEKLYNPDVDDDDKKTLICQLASFDKVDYFRALEKYIELVDEQLKSWATLAVQESRMLIESSLLDEKQLFISTGLGGKGSKLRYFVALISTSNGAFTPAHQDIINKEFSFNLNKFDGELEEIVFDDKFAMMTCLLPIQKPIQEILNKTTQECNTFGNFIQKNILITNVKKLSTDEIHDFLNSKTNKSQYNISLDTDTLESNDEDV